MHHKEIPRGEPAGRVERAEALEFAPPLIEVRREPRRANRADLPGVLEEASGLVRPVLEAGPCAEHHRTVHTRVVGPDTERDRSAGVGTDQPHPERIGLLHDHIDGTFQVIDPALQ